jgi:hypothetical protein
MTTTGAPMISLTCPICRLPIAISEAAIEAGARAAMVRITRRHDSALQLISNPESLPIPKQLVEEVRAAVTAVVAKACAEATAAAEAIPEGPAG